MGAEVHKNLRDVNSDSARNRADFYQAHLDRVSRSFAFCIARLEGSLREHVGLSYLLCRMVDTIEDAGWPNFASQEIAFKKFDRFLLARPENTEIEVWVRGFPNGLPEGEVLLLEDAALIFSDFHDLADDLRVPLSRSILSMSGGMRHYMARKSQTKSGKLILTNATDVNRYCFFVAGVVGEILARLVGRDSSTLQRLKDAFRFGLFLQKVNLLKDQRSDEKVGRHLVPSRTNMFASLVHDAEAAMRFLKSLPEKEVGFRLFCAWSLFLGLASLPWIERAYDEKANLKIPREETLILLGTIEDTITDNSGLDRLFESMKPKENALSDISKLERDTAEEEVLVSLYRGELPKASVLELFSES